jgi:hypothetical protein
VIHKFLNCGSQVRVLPGTPTISITYMTCSGHAAVLGIPKVSPDPNSRRNEGRKNSETGGLRTLSGMAGRGRRLVGIMAAEPLNWLTFRVDAPAGPPIAVTEKPIASTIYPVRPPALFISPSGGRFRAYLTFRRQTYDRARETAIDSMHAHGRRIPK